MVRSLPTHRAHGQPMMQNARWLLALGGLAILAFAAVFVSPPQQNLESERKLQDDMVEDRQIIMMGDLPVLQGFGGNPDPSLFPLQVCQGDCDNDDMCDFGLICYQRDANEPVPGCLGGDSFSSNSDFCIVDPMNIPIATQPTPSPTPTADLPRVEFVGKKGDPPEAFPLDVCQADCDSDQDCKYGLYCYDRKNKEDPTPGCNSEDENWIKNADICIPRPDSAGLLEGAFRLRLYWEKGYVWQESTRERWWCATTHYKGYPGPGYVSSFLA